MKIYTKFILVSWLRLVKFTESNISKFWFLNFNYNISYHWETATKYNNSGNFDLANLPLAKWRNLNSNDNFLPGGYINDWWHNFKFSIFLATQLVPVCSMKWETYVYHVLNFDSTEEQGNCAMSCIANEI